MMRSNYDDYQRAKREDELLERDVSTPFRATPNIDQKKFPDIQDYSDWQSARILELTKRIAELKAVAIEAWQAGFSRGHDDTVEGCFNPGWADDPEAAQEWLTEREQSDEPRKRPIQGGWLEKDTTTGEVHEPTWTRKGDEQSY